MTVTIGRRELLAALGGVAAACAARARQARRTRGLVIVIAPASMGTLAPEKHLFLNVRCERFVGTLIGKNVMTSTNGSICSESRR
jgi:hypothetical protein